MPIGGKSVGRDITLQVTTQDGVLNITSDMISEFDMKPDAEFKDYVPVTGLRESDVLHLGWSGFIELIRKNSVMDTFWALMESNYFAGENVEDATITETIQEADGTISQWIYTGVSLLLQEAGSWKGNEYVMQRLSCKASRKIKQV